MTARWQIAEYVAKASGRRPLVEFYKGLKSVEDRTDFVAAVTALGEFGNALGMPHSRPLGDKLFELRQGRIRIFYVFSGKQSATLLHTFLKQGQKTPAGEIETARKRAREVLE